MDVAGEFTFYTDNEHDQGARMPKKSESVRGSKSDNAHSAMKDRAKKPGREEVSYDGGERRKKDREMVPSGSGNKNAFDGIEKPMGENDNVFTDIKKMSGGKKSKNGCFPKLFMLLLSITAGAAYFFLSS
jgi:hypothetical protein